MSDVAYIAAPFTANAKQDEAAQAWRDPDVRVVVVGGAIRSGKTQAAGRLIVETAIDFPSTYLVARLGYRQLEDSTKKAMLHGDGAMPPLIPPELVADYRATDNMVRLKTGSEILFRSLDDPAKLLNLTIGGIFVDQIEELDHGPDGERIYDTLLGRLSDPRGPRKLIAVANPSSTVSWQYRRLVNERTKDKRTRYVHVRLSDNAANLPPDYVADLEATKTTRPHWHKAFVEGAWGSFEGAAYEEFDPAIHVVEPFDLPESWSERFESLDFGAHAPTAVLAWVADPDGCVIAFDEYYEAGKLVSEHAPEILRRRERWYAERQRPVCYADPSIWSQHGHSNSWGQPHAIVDEFYDHKLSGLHRANNDRAAGFVRISELLHPHPELPFPSWHPRSGEKGSPRLFIFRHCTNLIEQTTNAPIALEGLDAGKAVDPKVESARLHAHAAARYGLMSRPSPSPLPRDNDHEDPRTELLRRYEARLDSHLAHGRFIRT